MTAVALLTCVLAAGLSNRTVLDINVASVLLPRRAVTLPGDPIPTSEMVRPLVDASLPGKRETSTLGGRQTSGDEDVAEPTAVDSSDLRPHHSQYLMHLLGIHSCGLCLWLMLTQVTVRFTGANLNVDRSFNAPSAGVLLRHWRSENRLIVQLMLPYLEPSRGQRYPKHLDQTRSGGPEERSRSRCNLTR